jgi:hypothetical protein
MDKIMKNQDGSKGPVKRIQQEEMKNSIDAR